MYTVKTPQDLLKHWGTDGNMFVYAKPSKDTPAVLLPVMQVRGWGGLTSKFSEEESAKFQSFVLNLVSKVPDMVQALKDVSDTASMSPVLRVVVDKLIEAADYNKYNHKD